VEEEEVEEEEEEKVKREEEGKKGRRREERKEEEKERDRVKPTSNGERKWNGLAVCGGVELEWSSLRSAIQRTPAPSRR